MDTYNPKLMMDSGAWSAFTHKEEIDLAKYCDFLHENMDCIDTYVALDKIIPGDTERAASEGFANWQYMCSRGLKDAIPVFHQGEHIKWLYKYLDAGATYIGISATSLAQKQAIDQWYHMVWRHIVNKDGLPIVRTHAFGDTRERPLLTFPWASCDSSSWIYFSQVFGLIRLDDEAIPHRRRIVGLSQRNDGQVSSRSVQDLDRLAPAEKEALYALLARNHIKQDIFSQRMSRETSGRGHRYSEADRIIATRTLLARSVLTIRSYQAMAARAAALVPKRFYYEPVSWGNTPRADFAEWPVDPKYTEFALYLAIGGNSMTLPLTYVTRHEQILASYYYLSGNNTNLKRLQAIRSYITDPAGTVRTPPAKRYAEMLDTIFTEEPHASPSTLHDPLPLQQADQQAGAGG